MDGTLKAWIERTLTGALQPDHLVVIDESAAHHGHSGSRLGGETHFRLRIVSSRFAGQNRIERHRVIHEVLQEAFAQGLHALAIEAAAPGEPTRW